MPRQGHSGFWRVVRRLFRWFRIGVWLLLLALLIALIWFNQVGLPGFIKEQLVRQLRAEGIDLHFSRLHLHWYRGIVAEQIRIGKPAVTNAPQVSATEAEVRLDPRALLLGDVKVTGVGLRGGRMIVPVWGTNAEPRELFVEKVSGELHFRARDQWEVTSFRARAFGVNLALSGVITNGSAIGSWRLVREKPPRPRSAEAFWHDLVSRLQQSRFEEPASIVGIVRGDARAPHTFQATLEVSSPGVDSPWGRGRNLMLTAELAPSAEGAFAAELNVSAQDAVTRWVEAEMLQLHANVAPSFTRWTPTNAQLRVTVRRGRTPWGIGGNFTLQANFRPSPADPEASLAEYTLRAQQIETPWARIARSEMTAQAVLTSSNLWPSRTTANVQFSGGEMNWGRAAAGTFEAALTLPPLERMEFANTNLSWWTRLDRVQGDLRAKLDRLVMPELELRSVAWAAEWRAPVLRVREISGVHESGEFSGQLSLSTETRVAEALVKSTLDPHRFAPLLSTNTRRWLAQYTWETPPRLSGVVRAELPPWTDAARPWREVNWERDVAPTISLSGELEVGRATYQTVPLESARSHVGFSNLMWNLPDLVITRPEGTAVIAHAANAQTHEYEFAFDSRLNPQVLRPLLHTNEQRVLDEFTFQHPPHVRGNLRGRWYAPEETTFRLSVAATNLTFRDQPVKSCRSTITLTNQVLVFHEPDVERTEGAARADSVQIDFPRRTIWINNATGRLDVAEVTHMIGDDVEETMRPYRFLSAPAGRVHGTLTLGDVPGTDLMFQFYGSPFAWETFHFSAATGTVHWLDHILTLSNVSGAFHNGQLEASARFDFTAREGADFSFRTLVRGVNLGSMVAEVTGHTNKVEGMLNGTLIITNANTAQALSWNGYGDISVQDGLLWDFPIFGLFSPLLNAIRPGAGNSRAKEAVATFVVTNSVIQSTDLAIQASGMRLKYEGAVDFKGNINGRMEAQLFRDTPGLGPIVSTVFWPVTKLFEYRIGGTLGKPEAEPLYIPKLFLMPFHPLRTLRELIEVERETPETEKP